MIVNDIIDFLKKMNIVYEMNGDEKTEIYSFCSIDHLKDNSITWVRFIDDVDVSKFDCFNNIVLFAEMKDKKEKGFFNFCVIYVNNVHSVFFHVIEEFFSDYDPNNAQPLIEKNATVLTNHVGKNVYIGYNTFIGENVEIGNNVRILNNVVIQGKVIIKDNCFIDSNSTIGANGFGHFKDMDGKNKTIPHLGGVYIGQNVDIGSNTCIARGCLDDTVIEDDVKIDSMCFIAHNVVIKRNTMVVAGTCIGGSSTIEKDSWLGINCTISDQIIVGENSYVGMSTLVNKTIPSNKVLVGVPARVLRENGSDSKIKHKKRG